MAPLIGNKARGLNSTGSSLSKNRGLFTKSASFTPIDLAPLIWLDANENVIESGGAVSQWGDKSGNGNDFTQLTGSLQPTLQPTGILGSPAIDFDGTDEMISGTLSSSLAEASIYCLWVSNGGSPSGPSIMGQTSGTNDKRIFTTPPDASSRVFLWDGGTNSITAESTTYNYDTAPILSLNRVDSLGNGNGKINDDTYSSTTSIFSLTTSSSPIKIGNRGSGTSRRLDGKIAQLLIYPNYHTDKQVDLIFNYFNSLYSIW